jgi:predicted dehydrogenase
MRSRLVCNCRAWLAAAAARLDLSPDLPDDLAVCGHSDVDVVLVLTSMTEHGRLARAALQAGKHVLVEKPVATTLAEAEQVLEVAASAPGHLICAPHILLSPTYRAMHARVAAGEIGGLLTARARYGSQRVMTARHCPTIATSDSRRGPSR